jgi:glutathione S-transferase
MSASYRIFGAEVSPYSVKVRSYFRYKGVPHEWIVRSSATQAEYQKHAKLPLIPLVVTPDGEGIQDSTPILERLEARFPEPSIHPRDGALRFLSELLEEFADEWGNKWMFHYRWAREVDQDSAAERIARTMMPGAEGEALRGAIAGIKERMIGRVWFVGSSPKTAREIEESFCDTVALLEAHLARRPFLFGRRPALADFGLWGQFYNAWTDPTPGGILNQRAPAVVGWVRRMLDPKAEGDFETWPALEPTLLPLLERQVARLFLPWSDANATAIASGAEELRVELDGRAWTQRPQKYHAKSLAELRRKYAAVADRSQLDPILERAGCLRWLRSSSPTP